jgi:hypothetical protein
MDWFAILTSPSASLIVAGAMGGICRWGTLALTTKKLEMTQGLVTVMLGAILGYYASPSFEGTVRGFFPTLSVDPDKFPTFVAFVTGVGGITVIAFIIDLWTRAQRQPEPPPAVDPVPPKP